MKKFYIPLIIMVLYSTPLPIFAQSPYYISIHTAGHVFESNRNIGDTFLLGLGLGYQFNKRLSAAVRLYTGKYEIQYPLYNQTCTTDTQRGNLYHADLYYRFLPDSLIKPYITGGIGKFNVKHEKSEEFYQDSFDQGMLFNYGFGLEYDIQDISLMGDIRHFLATGDSRNEMVLSVGLIYCLPEWN
ncbi:MAG: porin family protein [Candidatus Magnetomorum sp.]|nr:porin family protein [Candidatus Magnetomorum sp.]